MQALIGFKKTQSQRFLENGKRIPVTLIDVKDNVVVAVKTMDKDHYQAIQLGIGSKKNTNKAELGHANKGAKLEKAPKFLREVRVNDESETLPEVGAVVVPSEVLQPGDIINVTGVSKGKGYAGVVKRHNFRWGPKTHGQSDRHRAPGAIGQGTTPGRVYKGKRMSGRMGNDNVTVTNLEVIDITNDGVLIVKGLVPGVINGLIYIEKVGEDKKFVPLYKSPEEKEQEEAAKAESTQVEETAAPSEEVKEVESESPVVEVAGEEESSEQAEEVSENTEENKEEVKEGEEDGNK